LPKCKAIPRLPAARIKSEGDLPSFAHGGWKDGETLYQEYTLVIYSSETAIKNVYASADGMMRVLNRKSPTNRRHF